MSSSLGVFSNTNASSFLSLPFECGIDWIDLVSSSRHISFAQLPSNVRVAIGEDKALFRELLLEACIRLAISFDESPFSPSLEEGVDPSLRMTKEDYYSILVTESRRRLRFFPYHAVEAIRRATGVSPHSYYAQMMLELIKEGFSKTRREDIPLTFKKSYDSLPNFTAADCVRLLRIGRNQYIEICQKCRAKMMWRFNKSLAKEFIPSAPITEGISLMEWWEIALEPSSLESMRILPGASLHTASRSSSPFEIDTQTTAEEAAAVNELLRISFPDFRNLLQPNTSLSSAQSSYLQQRMKEESSCISSFIELIRRSKSRSRSSTASASSSARTRDENSLSQYIPLCFFPSQVIRRLLQEEVVNLRVPISDEDVIVVPTLHGFVMNRGIQHADLFEKTMYEFLLITDVRTTIRDAAEILGRPLWLVRAVASAALQLGFALLHSSSVDHVADLLVRPEFSHFERNSSWDAERARVQNLGGEWQVVEFGGMEGDDLLFSSNSSPAHSATSKTTSQFDDFFSSNTISEPFPEAKSAESVVRPVSPSSTDVGDRRKRVAFLFDANLAAFLMMGNLSVALKDFAVTLFEAGRLPDEQLSSFVRTLELVDSAPVYAMDIEAQQYFENALALKDLLPRLREREDISDTESASRRVDMVRVESLHELSDDVIVRFLERNYHTLLCIAPLAPAALNFTQTIPRFVGPVHPLMSSVWWKLWLYHACSNGPVSFFYPRGYRVSSLPSIVLSARKVLIQPARGDPVEHGPSQQSILQLLNESLLSSAILLQIRCRFSSDDAVVAVDRRNEIDRVYVALPLPKDVATLSDEELFRLIWIPPNMKSHKSVSSMDDFDDLQDSDLNPSMTNLLEVPTSSSVSDNAHNSDDFAKSEEWIIDSGTLSKDASSEDIELSYEERTSICTLLRSIMEEPSVSASFLASLTSVPGYAELWKCGSCMRLPMESNSSRIGLTWCFGDIHHGLPLFSRKLSDLVQTAARLSEEVLDEWTQRIEALLADLDDFSRRYARRIPLSCSDAITRSFEEEEEEEEEEPFPHGIPYPSRPIVFNGSRISFL